MWLALKNHKILYAIMKCTNIFSEYIFEPIFFQGKRTKSLLFIDNIFRLPPQKQVGKIPKRGSGSDTAIYLQHFHPPAFLPTQGHHDSLEPIP